MDKRVEEFNIDDQLNVAMPATSKDNFYSYAISKYTILNKDKIDNVLSAIFEIEKDNNLYESALIIIPTWYENNKNVFNKHGVSLADIQLVICILLDYLVNLAKDSGKPNEIVNKVLWDFLTKEQSSWLNKCILLMGSVGVRKQVPEIFDEEEHKLINYVVQDRTNKQLNKKANWKKTDIYIIWSIMKQPVNYDKFIQMSDMTKLNAELLNKEPEQLGELAQVVQTTPSINWKKILFYSGLIAAVGVGGYIYYRHRKNIKQNCELNTDTDDTDIIDEANEEAESDESVSE